ncbi:hypothetical protein scyTo_0020055, partial [Scyliorhinus torazame]|nr:hypothetical protein [Scyliorhinus torazame]
LYNNFLTILDFLPGPHKKLFQNAADLLNFIKQMIQSHKESLQKDFPRDYIDSFLIKMEEEQHKHDLEFILMNLSWQSIHKFSKKFIERLMKWLDPVEDPLLKIE